MGMPGVSVKDAFLAVAKTDRYRNKWMLDLLWVDLIQKTYCRLQVPYKRSACMVALSHEANCNYSVVCSYYFARCCYSIACPSIVCSFRTCLLHTFLHQH